MIKESLCPGGLPAWQGQELPEARETQLNPGWRWGRQSRVLTGDGERTVTLVHPSPAKLHRASEHGGSENPRLPPSLPKPTEKSCVGEGPGKGEGKSWGINWNKLRHVNL